MLTTLTSTFLDVMTKCSVVPTWWTPGRTVPWIRKSVPQLGPLGDSLVGRQVVVHGVGQAPGHQEPESANDDYGGHDFLLAATKRPPAPGPGQSYRWWSTVAMRTTAPLNSRTLQVSADRPGPCAQVHEPVSSEASVPLGAAGPDVATAGPGAMGRLGARKPPAASERRSARSRRTVRSA